MTLPGPQGGATRTIAAQALDSTGDAARGLTGAHFAGDIQFAEKGAGIDRAARSALLRLLGSGCLKHWSADLEDEQPAKPIAPRITTAAVNFVM